MERNARSALIWEVVTQYLQASLEFVEAVERCAAKGWPDRTIELRAATIAQKLLCDRELARLKYALGTDPDAALDSYKEIGLVIGRLRERWTAQEEQALRARDPAYVAIETQIATMRRFDKELEEPFKMAQVDPELHEAGRKFKEIARALEARLGQ